MTESPRVNAEGARPARARDELPEWLPYALMFGISGLAITAFFFSCLQRLPYPIELGSGEGTLMDHAIRFAAGKPVYQAPSFEFTPLAYMPGMPLLAAPLVRLFGPHLWEGRLLDLVAAVLLCGVFLFAMRRETGSLALGLAATGIFYMGQGFTQGCYDVFRPDLVMLLLAFGGATALRFTDSARGAVLAALLFSLSFTVKQHGLVFGAAMVPYLFFADRRRLGVYTLALALFAGGFFLLLRLWLGPWFTFYVFEVPSHWSQFSRTRIEHYLANEAFGHFGMLTVPAALALMTQPWRERIGVWWWMAIGGACTGLMATLDPYAFLHTLMPSLCAFAFVGPLALARIGRELPPARRAGWAWAMTAVLTMQLIALPFSPRALRPHAHGDRALADFTAFLANQSRPVLLFHGFYSTAAGKSTTLSILPLDDVVRARGNSLLRRDPHYFDHMFAALRRGPGRPIIIADTTLDQVGDVSKPYWAAIAPGYRLEGDLGALGRVLHPVVGTHDAPRYLYAPIDEQSADTTAVRVTPPAADSVLAPQR